jgi:hypothetical protein
MPSIASAGLSDTSSMSSLSSLKNDMARSIGSRKQLDRA